jgi:predicted dehydrogenase
MPDEIGAGIVGAGFGARVHLPGLRRLDAVRVRGIAATNMERARQAAGPAGIDAFDDYRRLLDRPDVQLVAVAAPAPFHHEIVLAALERGKHVICEKPFAGSVAQAEDMLRRAQAAGVVHAIDFEFRYFAPRQQLRALLADGYVGRPRLFNALVLSPMRGDPARPVPAWSVTRQGLGGPLGAIGVHVMDAACQLLGEVAGLSAQLDQFFAERAIPGGQTLRATCEDRFAALLRFRGGALGNVECCYAASQGCHRMELHGDEGSLVAPDHRTLLGARGGGELAPLPIDHRFRPAGGWLPPAGSPDHLAPFAELAGRVVARIRGEDAGEFPTFEDGLRSQRLVEAVFRSADSGCAVDVG